MVNHFLFTLFSLLIMTNTDFGSLKRPPIHPARLNAEQSRENEIQQSMNSMPEQDRQFMYDMHKQNQHAEKVLTSFLSLIRQYDFLPRKVLLNGFQNAVKHIYAEQENARKENAIQDSFLNETFKVCESLQGVNE